MLLALAEKIAHSWQTCGLHNFDLPKQVLESQLTRQSNLLRILAVSTNYAFGVFVPFGSDHIKTPPVWVLFSFLRMLYIKRDTLRFVIFRPLRAVAEKFLARDFTVPKASRGFRAATTNNAFGVFVPFGSDHIKTPPVWVVFLYGGEKGIRTLETLSTPTRFPIVRLRPAQPSLHLIDLVIIQQLF